MNSISTFEKCFGISLESLLECFVIIVRRKICKRTFVFGVPSTTIIVILTCCLFYLYLVPATFGRIEFLPLEVVVWNSPACISLKMARNNGKKTIYLLDVKSEVLAIVILV